MTVPQPVIAAIVSAFTIMGGRHSNKHYGRDKPAHKLWITLSTLSP